MNIAPLCPACRRPLKIARVAILTNWNTTTCTSCGSGIGLRRGRAWIPLAVLLVALQLVTPVARALAPPDYARAASAIVFAVIVATGLFVMTKYAQLEVRRSPDR